jgi:glucokinase
VLDRANKVPTSLANETIDLFCGFLGAVAGDLALTLGARGGIYIGGGIVPRLGVRLDSSTFRERFEAKGRFKSYLQTVPTWVIGSLVLPVLLGASTALTLQQW